MVGCGGESKAPPAGDDTSPAPPENSHAQDDDPPVEAAAVAMPAFYRSNWLAPYFDLAGYNAREQTSRAHLGGEKKGGQRTVEIHPSRSDYDTLWFLKTQAATNAKSMRLLCPIDYNTDCFNYPRGVARVEKKGTVFAWATRRRRRHRCSRNLPKMKIPSRNAGLKVLL